MLKTPTKFGEILGLNSTKKRRYKYNKHKGKKIILCIPKGSIVKDFNPNIQ